MIERKAMTKKETNLPAAINLEEMAGQGQEFVTARDQKLPILKLSSLIAEYRKINFSKHDQKHCSYNVTLTFTISTYPEDLERPWM